MEIKSSRKWMQQTATKEIQDLAWLGVGDDPVRIVQENEVWPYLWYNSN